jgi:hypothetical protein
MKLTDYTIYEHDALGQPVKEIVYSSNNMPFRWTINTFSNGLMIKSEIFRDENLELKWREIKRNFSEFLHITPIAIDNCHYGMQKLCPAGYRCAASHTPFIGTSFCHVGLEPLSVKPIK